MKRSERLYSQSRRLALHALVSLSAGGSAGVWAVVAIRDSLALGVSLLVIASAAIMFAALKLGHAEHAAKLGDEECWAERRRETRPRL